MFGYVRPLKGELKVREFEQYKAAYCGLCHCLKTRYGLAARFCVNYDLTFLAMLLAEGTALQCVPRRCPTHLFRKKPCACLDAAMDRAAACSVILCYWKLEDMGADGGPMDRLKAAFGKRMLRGAVRRAEQALPSFGQHVRQSLADLSKLEKAGCTSLDQTADTFACLLRAAAPEEGDPARRRVLEELLYHVGRWIYIVDAADDLKQDLAQGNYNALAARFDLKEARFSDAQRTWVETTLKHSANLAAAALELLDESAWSGILRNILYLGLPSVADLVLEGRFVPTKNRRPG